MASTIERRGITPGSFLVIPSEELGTEHVIVDIIHQSPKTIVAANNLLEIEHPELWDEGYRVADLREVVTNGTKEIVLRLNQEMFGKYSGEIPEGQEALETDDIPF